MLEQNDTNIDHKVGDKVQIRSGDQKGQRGVIQIVSDGQLEVQLKAGGITTVLISNVTNFSLAARKAWRTMRSQP